METDAPEASDPGPAEETDRAVRGIAGSRVGGKEGPTSGDEKPTGSTVVESRGFRWEGVDVREYKQDDADRFRDVLRQSLLGEEEGQEALSFVTRYFEVEPGGYSSLERHEHPHAVVVIRGRGRVALGDRVHEIQPFDCVYVAPGEVHRFRADGDEPLGFLCVVDRDRDRPVAVPEDEDPSSPV